MIKKYQKILARKEYMSENYKKTLKTYHKWLNRRNNKIKDKYHKYKQKTRRKLRHHINGESKRERNVSKQKMGTKTTKNKPIQTSTNDQIQGKMVRQKIHTNQPILPFQPTMQQLRIPIH